MTPVARAAEAAERLLGWRHLQKYSRMSEGWMRWVLIAIARNAFESIDVDELARVVGERYAIAGMCDRGCECEDCMYIRRSVACDFKTHLLGDENHE